MPLLSRTKPRPRRAAPRGLEMAEVALAPISQIQGSAGADVPVSQPDVIVRGRTDVPIRPKFIPPPGGLETIIREDDRVRITETKAPPWRMIAQLEIFRPDSNDPMGVGTAWFVSRTTLVTAGHCVYSNFFFGGWAGKIRISAGRNGPELPFNSITADRFTAPEAWTDTEKPEFDIGCIQLDAPVDAAIGSFQVTALEDNDLIARRINVSGYPSDKANGTEQYHHANRILRVAERRVFYDVDTVGGQSGSPAFVYDEGSDAPRVIGVHTYGVSATPTDFHIEANSATRITPEIVELVQGWIAANKQA
jgi:glutamyl endopeptidase